MRYVVLFGLLAIAVYSAPVENDEAIRVRRAQEIVMFGNQQNESKDKIKRSEDEQVVGEEDKNGSIVSLEPKEIEPVVDTETEEVDSDNEENSVDETQETETIDETLAPEEDAPNSEEVLENEQPEENEMPLMPLTDDNEDYDAQTRKEYQKFFKQLETENLLPEYYDLLTNQQPYNGYYDTYPYGNIGFRKRRSQERVFTGDKAPRARVLKRSRRIKRDLIYPSESLNRDYLYDGGYPAGESNYNDLVGYLMDLLDEKYNEEPLYTSQPGFDEEIDGYEPYEDVEEPIVEDLYPGYPYSELERVMPKRQAGLTFVPGFKRNFYPYFEEPASHFQAFVPNKRATDDYAETYRRLMGLGSALRQNGYNPNAYRYQDFDFRRK